LTLKTLVGLKTLVEGLGIGKGKQYLTGLSIDSVNCGKIVYNIYTFRNNKFSNVWLHIK